MIEHEKRSPDPSEEKRHAPSGNALPLLIGLALLLGLVILYGMSTN
ncbi:MAG TPA: hypothetical protein VFZ53_26400 [Polyangiaceae bacterium]